MTSLTNEQFLQWTAEIDRLPTSWLLQMLRYECENISTRREQM